MFAILDILYAFIGQSAFMHLNTTLDFASALFAVALALLTRHYTRSKAGRYFILFLLGIGEFAAAVGMETLFPTLAEKILWGKMQYLGLVAAAPAWFLFLATYTRQSWLTRRAEYVAWIVPVTTLVAVWTNDHHHLFWPTVKLISPTETGVYAHGFFFWVFIAYHYIFILLGFLLMYLEIARKPYLYRRQALSFAIASFLIVVSNIFYLLNPQKYSLSLMASIPVLISAPLLLWAFFTKNFFHLQPIAHHLFFQHNTDACLMVNANEFVVEANPRWVEVSCTPLKDIVGKPLATVLSSSWDAVLDCIRREDYTSSQKVRLAKRCGEQTIVLDVNIIPVYDEQHRYAGVVITGKDVTEEERARRQLEIQLTALESIASGVLITDAEGRIEWGNRAFTAITGHKLDDVRGKNLFSMHEGLPDRKVLFAWQTTRPPEKMWSGEISNHRKDGETYYEQCTIIPLANRRGEVRHLVITIEDITERKKSTLALQANLRHMHLLYEVSQIAASQADPDVLARSIGQHVQDALDAQALSVAFYDSESGLITIPYWNMDGKVMIGPTLRYGEGITSHVIRTRQPLVIDENFAVRAPKYNVVYVSPDISAKTWAAVPVIVRDEVIGVISIQDYHREHAFTSEQLDILTTIASTLGVALANARLSFALQKELEEMERIKRELERVNKRLHIQAVRDPLTNLFNRRYLNEHLDGMLVYHGHSGRTLCVVMLDIDHFKRFNDTYGHDVGDVLLKNLGNILLKHTRKEDIPCRYGGEEFLIVLSNVDTAQAIEIVNKWRDLFAAIACQSLCEHMPTLSGGIAAYPLHADNGNTLLSKADQALYRAKQTGRDRVVVYGDDDEVLPEGVQLTEGA